MMIKKAGDQRIVEDLSLLIMRGDKIGLLGPNGAGKSTLINLILGKLQPDSGKVEQGTQLQVAYFSQGAANIDLKQNVCDFVAEGRDRIDIGGKSTHIISYLSDFLFTAEKARTELGRLSGGELNRAIFARLFSQPANLLVLDEPTNDLDMETMELLEEQLLAYPGTVLLVSHDRQFLDNIVTSTLAFEGQGKVREYVGGYKDYLRQQSMSPNTESSAKGSPTASTASGTVKTEDKTEDKKQKLSYKLQRELTALPDTIAKLEARQTELETEVSQPGFFEQEHAVYSVITDELDTVNAELEAALERWLELEG